MSWQRDRNNEPMLAQRVEYVQDLDQWLYNKRAPFPGALTAPLFRVPNLRGFWSAPFDQYTMRWQDLTGQGIYLSNTWGSTDVGIDVSTTWPGAMVPYNYIATGAVDRFHLNNSTGCAWTNDLTVCAWAKLPVLTWTKTPDTYTTQMVCKQDNQYWLRYDRDTAKYRFWISTVGNFDDAWVPPDNKYVKTDSSPVANTWHMVIGRYTPSAELVVRLDNDSWTEYGGAVPAAMFSATNTLFALDNVYSDGGAAENIRLAQLWIANYAVSDALLNWLWAIQAPYFGRT